VAQGTFCVYNVTVYVQNKCILTYMCSYQNTEYCMLCPLQDGSAVILSGNMAVQELSAEALHV